MNTLIEQIREELARAHRADIPVIKKYIAWVKFRRRMHNEFYMAVHWVQVPHKQYHWITAP